MVAVDDVLAERPVFLAEHKLAYFASENPCFAEDQGFLFPGQT